ncbi:Uncharacterised protein [Mycobacteroides abscessus]|nr:Uncharacterised protein [Mycobacteroides abscessus]
MQELAAAFRQPVERGPEGAVALVAEHLDVRRRVARRELGDALVGVVRELGAPSGLVAVLAHGLPGRALGCDEQPLEDGVRLLDGHRVAHERDPHRLDEVVGLLALHALRAHRVPQEGGRLADEVPERLRAAVAVLQERERAPVPQAEARFAGVGHLVGRSGHGAHCPRHARPVRHQRGVPGSA